MNKLELKDIAGYLPYGLKVERPDGKTILEMYGILGTLIQHKEDNEITYSSLSGCKPLLRPMSDLYKPCLPDGKIPIVELAKIAVLGQNNCDDLLWDIDSSYEYVSAIKKEYEYCFGYDNVGAFWINKEDICDRYFTDIDINSQLQLFQKLYEWHFDIHGLIDKGIAIDLNTIKQRL